MKIEKIHKKLYYCSFVFKNPILKKLRYIVIICHIWASPPPPTSDDIIFAQPTTVKKSHLWEKSYDQKMDLEFFSK